MIHVNRFREGIIHLPHLKSFVDYQSLLLNLQHVNTCNKQCQGYYPSDFIGIDMGYLFYFNEKGACGFFSG